MMRYRSQIAPLLALVSLIASGGLPLGLPQTKHMQALLLFALALAVRGQATWEIFHSEILIVAHDTYHAIGIQPGPINRDQVNEALAADILEGVNRPSFRGFGVEYAVVIFDAMIQLPYNPRVDTDFIVWYRGTDGQLVGSGLFTYPQRGQPCPTFDRPQFTGRGGTPCANGGAIPLMRLIAPAYRGTLLLDRMPMFRSGMIFYAPTPAAYENSEPRHTDATAAESDMRAHVLPCFDAHRTFEVLHRPADLTVIAQCIREAASGALAVAVAPTDLFVFGNLPLSGLCGAAMPYGGILKFPDVLTLEKAGAHTAFLAVTAYVLPDPQVF